MFRTHMLHLPHATGFSLPRYADEDCTQPLPSPVSTCSPLAPGDYVPMPASPSSDSCSQATTLWQVGAAVTPDSLYQIAFDDGTCQPASVDPDATYYTAQAVNWSTFVGGTARSELVNAETQLQVNYIDGEDGSSIQVDLEADDSACAAVTFGGSESPTVEGIPAAGQTVCLGSAYTYFGTSFATSTCADTPVVQSFYPTECSTTEPEFILTTQRNDQGCESYAAVFGLGTHTEGMAYELNESDECTLSTANYELHIGLGDELAPDSLPQLQHVSRGRSRLRSRSVAASEKHITGSSEWFDEELGVKCEIMLTGDGQRRCVPLGSSFGSGVFYADAACTIELYTAGQRACPGTSDVDYAVYTDTDWDDELGRCWTRADRVLVLQRHDGSVYRSTPDCTEVDAPEFTFQLVRDLAPAELAQVELLIAE